MTKAMKIWMIVMTVLVVMISSSAGVGTMVLLQVKSQNTELVTASEKNILKMEELYSERKPYSRFFENDYNLELLRSVAEIRVKTIGGSDDFLANGFLTDNDTLITAGHVVDTIVKIQSKTANTSFYAKFPMIRNPLGDSPIMPLTLVNVSNDGLLGVACLSASDAALLRAMRFSYMKPAPKEKLKVGDTLVRVSVNPQRLSSLGTPFDFRIIEEVLVDGHYLESIFGDDAILGKIPENVKSNLRNLMFVSGGLPGDSGSPLLVLDRDNNEFLVGGVTEGSMIATRSDALSNFLNSFSCKLKSNSMPKKMIEPPEQSTPTSPSTPLPTPENCAIVSPPSPTQFFGDTCCIPPVPDMFSGRVFVGGKSAPDGVYVWAIIGDDYRTDAVRVENGRYTGLVVSPPKSTGYVGEKIEFYVNGKRTGNSVVFLSGLVNQTTDLYIDSC